MGAHEDQQPEQGSSQGTPEHRTLRAMGMTLIGVTLSIATTVGFSLPGPWWVRVGAGIASIFVIGAAIKVSTTQGSRGPVARLADWIMGQP